MSEYPGFQEPTIATVELVLRKYAAMEGVSPEMLEYAVDRDGISDMIMHRLVRRVATIEGERLHVPDGPWQMFKERHPRLLGWWTRRRLIRYHEYLAVEYIPDLSLPKKAPWIVRVASWEDQGLRRK